MTSSALERIETKLRELSDRVENVGHGGSNEDTKVLSGLVDQIRDAVMSCQVGGGGQTTSMI